MKFTRVLMILLSSSELTSLADALSCVRNLSVTAVTNSTTNGITFLYSVRDGACKQSFGIHVAEMARFPTQVVEAAKRKLADLEGEYGTDSGPPKRSKGVSAQDVASGQELISEFLDQIRRLPLDTESSRTHSVGEARRLREELIAKNNTYVGSLLADSMP